MVKSIKCELVIFYVKKLKSKVDLSEWSVCLQRLSYDFSSFIPNVIV